MAKTSKDTKSIITQTKRSLISWAWFIGILLIAAVCSAALFLYLQASYAHKSVPASGVSPWLWATIAGGLTIFTYIVCLRLFRLPDIKGDMPLSNPPTQGNTDKKSSLKNTNQTANRATVTFSTGVRKRPLSKTESNKRQS